MIQHTFVPIGMSTIFDEGILKKTTTKTFYYVKEMINKISVKKEKYNFNKM
jgi:hypothetical protein